MPNLTNSGRPPKRATLTADLIDLWNASFFIRRGVEVVLYKGRERRSGPNAGVADLPPHLLTADSLSSSSEDDSDSDDEDPNISYGYYRPGGGQGSMAEVLEIRRRRNELRAEKTRRRKERKLRRKEKARERQYALYLTCVRPGGPGSSFSSYMGPEHR